MAVALTGLAVALGGTAFTAGGGFEDAAGTVQACVTTGNVLRDVTGVIDGATGNAVAPGTAAANGLSDGTKVLTPKGTVLAVRAGETCPAGSTPQRLAAPSAVISATGKDVALGNGKSKIVSVDAPAGTNVISGTVKIAMRGDSTVDHTIKCALAGPDAKTIPGTTSQVTIDAHEPGDWTTIPIDAVVKAAAGAISVVCKDAARAEKPDSNARAALTDHQLEGQAVLILENHPALD